MLLTINCRGPQANELGFLLHKHPDRFQSISMSHGCCHVFYPESTDHSVTACLMLDIDPVAMIKNKRNRRNSFALAGYVNDRPYVASSFLSVAIANAFGTAMAGICKKHPSATGIEFPLKVSIDVMPCRGGADHLKRVFEPLGYGVDAEVIQLDSKFPSWGSSPYFSVTLTGTTTISRLLQHLYVLAPVFDNQKHYFVDHAELEKLLSKGEGWLDSHPEKEFIVSRYLKYSRGLANEALARLSGNEDEATNKMPATASNDANRPRLNDQRLDAVQHQLEACGASTVVDLGCGEGKLLRRLLKKWQFRELVGVDVSIAALEVASKRLRLKDLPKFQCDRVNLLHGSLMYRDKRFAGFDAAVVVEVIEHLDPPRLAAFEQVVFKHARPKTVILTTPNSEYNVMWPSLPAGKFRHPDHRFEWNRQKFEDWARQTATSHGYTVGFFPVGEEEPEIGAPTQMAVFNLGAEVEA
jgi:3' terminal RNA ribose 2'-O-methyltransferase Hen1